MVTASEPTGPTTRRQAHLLQARDLLQTWRSNVWIQTYSGVPYGPEGILPSSLLDRIASNTRIRNIEDLITCGWMAFQAEKHGDEVLKLLRELDEQIQLEKDAERAAREADKAQRSEAKKSETAARREAKKAEKEAERERQKELRKLQPKPSRPSRAKTRASQHSSQNIAPSALPTFPATSIVGTSMMALPVISAAGVPSTNHVQALYSQPLTTTNPPSVHLCYPMPSLHTPPSTPVPVTQMYSPVFPATYDSCSPMYPQARPRAQHDRLISPSLAYPSPSTGLQSPPSPNHIAFQMPPPQSLSPMTSMPHGYVMLNDRAQSYTSDYLFFNLHCSFH